ncbi:MAG: hypothetical protein ABSA81_07715 [Candidatus Bathyarchaeia archaeon]|jgi:hypothetical protein
METSFLSNQLKRAGHFLRAGALDRISDYNQRFSSASDVYDALLSNLIIQDFSAERARETALKLFGSERVKFAAVDGTEYARNMFDLIIFFGGAYVSFGTVTFHKGVKPSVEHAGKLLEHGRGISSCVPLYVNEVSDVDSMIDMIGGKKPLDDKAIFDNSRIADWIMAFSEFYLAYRLIIDEDVRILLMDRTLSGEHSALLSDTAHGQRLREKSGLCGFDLDDQPVRMEEMIYCRHRFVNRALDLPPPRGDYLRPRLLYELETATSLTLDELCGRLHLEHADCKRRAKKILDGLQKAELVQSTGSSYALKEEYRNSWERMKKLTCTIGDRLFLDQPLTEWPNPMMITKAGKPTWLTTVDMAFLTLFCLNMIIEECWKRPVLLIGLTKDTAARDFQRQVVKICSREHMWKLDLSSEALENIPRTDRMFLQSASVHNWDKLSVPWALVEYDTAFKTMVPELRNDKMPRRDGFVSGAVQNRVNSERLFLKSYVQLAQAEQDPKLRSNVLLTDRLVYPEFDLDHVCELSHEYGGVEEKVKPILFSNKEARNDIQNLVMVMLAAMTSTSIPEAFGHNVPLFIADNVAKWHTREFTRIVETTRDWIMTNHDLREFVFYMSTFRERRAEFESTRRGH